MDDKQLVFLTERINRIEKKLDFLLERKQIKLCESHLIELKNYYKFDMKDGNFKFIPEGMKCPKCLDEELKKSGGVGVCLA